MDDLSAFYSRRFAFSRARFRRQQQQQDIDARDASRFDAGIDWQVCAGGTIERERDGDSDDDAKTGPSESIEHDSSDCERWGACPHVDRNDARCGHRFSIGRLEQAFSVCFGSFHACPHYHRINNEVAIDGDPRGDCEGQRPHTLVEIRVLVPPTSHARARHGVEPRTLAGRDTGLGQLRQTGS